MPTLNLPPRLFKRFAEPYICRDRFTLARVGVFMCIGRWSKLLLRINGGRMPLDLSVFATGRDFKLTRRVRLTLRRYYVRPEPTIGNSDWPEMWSADR